VSAQHTSIAETRPLGILGIDEWEERVYRWLLAHPRVNVAEVAQGLSLPPARAQRLLSAIEGKGLTTHSLERPRRYTPTSPDIAIEALALQHQTAVQRAQSMVQELQGEMASEQPVEERELMVELISNREAEGQIIEQMQRAARDEVVVLTRAPIRISKAAPLNHSDRSTQRDAQARGVRYKNIVDSEYLALPGAIQRIRQDMQAGEEVRTVSHLPLKMFLTDRRSAIIPLNLEQPASPSLLVRSSALLDALYSLFQILWQRAAPLSFTRSGEIEPNDVNSQLPGGAEELLALLAAGINDKRIVHELGTSRSTFSRHMKEIMAALDARTRFQLGWRAALRLSGTADKSGFSTSKMPKA
jgi:sugar-specific transcriptional regulator TrmB